MALFEFIEAWNNPHHRHSPLGYLSPLAFERAALEREHGSTKIRGVKRRGSVLRDLRPVRGRARDTSSGTSL